MKRALWTVAAVVAGFVLTAAFLLVFWSLRQADPGIWVKIVVGVFLIGTWFAVFEWLGDRAPTLRAAVVFRYAYLSILWGVMALAVVVEDGLIEGGWTVVLIVAAIWFYWDNVAKPIRQLEARIAVLELEAQVADLGRDRMPE